MIGHSASVQRLTPTLLLLDLQLGQRSGLELLTEVQRRRLGVRVDDQSEKLAVPAVDPCHHGAVPT